LGGLYPGKHPQSPCEVRNAYLNDFDWQAMLKMGSIAVFQEMILEGTGPQVDRQFAVFVLSGCKVSFDELNGTLVNPRKFFNPQANDLWVYFKAIVGVRMIRSDISL
jgi:hypothetical protein